MKVALVNPPSEKNVIRRWRCAVEQGHYLFQPLELMYIGGVLKEKKDAEVILVDSVAEQLGVNEVSKILSDLGANLVIFLIGYENVERDIRVMAKIKEKVGCKLACFGHYATLFPKEIIEKYGVDFVIKGEPEFIVSELYDALNGSRKRLENIKGLTYMNGGSVEDNGGTGYVKDVNELPLPDRSLINNNLYSSGFPDKMPFTVMMFGRGCQFRCTYCVRSYGDELRWRSVDNMIKELKECVNKHKVKSFRILDDTFTSDHKILKEFCDKMVEENLRLEWTCLSRPDTLSVESLHWMKKAGCKRILVGIESGSKRVLKSYGRMYDPDKVAYLFKEMRKLGIESLCFFIVGGPNENPEDVEESKRIAKKINPDYITINAVRAYPGTSMYNVLKREGKVEFSLFPYKSEFEKEMNKDEIKNYLFKFYREFYFRPSYVANHLSLFLKHPLYYLSLGLEYFKWEGRGRNFAPTSNI